MVGLKLIHVSKMGPWWFSCELSNTPSFALEDQVKVALCYWCVTMSTTPWFNMVHNIAIQYTPRNMHTVFALLCFVVVIHWLIFRYPSGLLHWHCGNLTIAPVPAKLPWWIWINTSCEFIMNDCITTTKQRTTKPCAYFLGHTVPTRKAPPYSSVILNDI